MFKRLMAEALGTFFLVMTICGAVVGSARLSNHDSDILATALSAGLALAIASYLFSPVSGGHFNPALSLASWIAKQISGRQVLSYGAAQVLGGTAGALFIFLILTLQPGFQPLDFAANGYGQHSPGGYPELTVFAIEFVFTMALTMVFLHPGASQTSTAIWMGAAYGAAHLAIGTISRMSLNPARSTATALFAESWAIDQLWLFWLAPMTGATAGAYLSKYFAGNASG